MAANSAALWGIRIFKDSLLCDIVLLDLQSFFGKCHLAYRFYVHGADRHIALGEAASVIQSVVQGHAEIDKAISGIE